MSERALVCAGTHRFPLLIFKRVVVRYEWWGKDALVRSGISLCCMLTQSYPQPPESSHMSEYSDLSWIGGCWCARLSLALYHHWIALTGFSYNQRNGIISLLASENKNIAGKEENKRYCWDVRLRFFRLKCLRWLCDPQTLKKSFGDARQDAFNVLLFLNDFIVWCYHYYED